MSDHEKKPVNDSSAVDLKSKIGVTMVKTAKLDQVKAIANISR